MHKYEVDYKNLISENPLNVRGESFKSIQLAKISLNDTFFGYIHHLLNFHQIDLFKKVETVKKVLSRWDANRSINLSKLGLNQIDISTLDNFHKEEIFALESLFLQFHLQNKSIEEFQINSNSLYHKNKLIDSEVIKIKIDPNFIFDLELKTLINSKKIKKIRLDGNQKFQIEDLINVINQLDETTQLKIEYIEDPFINFYESYTFFNITKIPIAIDENLLNFFYNLNNVPKEFPIVIKASLWPISSVIQFANQNQKRKIIISSSYEPDPILKVLHFLAHETDKSTHVLNTHGLENIKYNNFPI